MVKRNRLSGKSNRKMQSAQAAEESPIVGSDRFDLPLDDSKYGGVLLILLVVGLWYWPLFFGACPVGGEISTVYLPELTFYADAMASGRWPLWNEKKDFGSSAIADAQIGVFYPVHQILFRWLDPLTAIGVSMLLHSWLAGLFAFYCARKFRIGRTAAALVGLAYVGQGFFASHADQLWAITTGCWLPLIVALAWLWLRDRHLFGLLAFPVALALQLLAGHYQIAFFSMVTVVIVSVTHLVIQPSRALLWNSLLLMAGIATAFGLAAIQLLPSAELIVCGDWRGRGQMYINSFASPGFNLIGFLSPKLFHDDPMWNTLVWAPLKTSSAETIVYIGFLPFVLSVWAMGKHRKDSLISQWLIPFVCVFLFSLGPLCPLNWLVDDLPGFCWFTAPARWSVVGGLFLALAFGWALDNVRLSELFDWIKRYLTYAVLLLACTTGAVVVFAGMHPKFDIPPMEYRGLNRLLEYFNNGYSAELLMEAATARLSDVLAIELLIPAISFIAVAVFANCQRLFKRVSPRKLGIVVTIWVVFDLTYHQLAIRSIRFDRAEQVASITNIAPIQFDDARIAGVLGALPMRDSLGALTAPDLPELSRYWDETSRSEMMDLWPETISTMPVVARWGDWGTRLGRVTREGFSNDDLVFCRLANIRRVVYGFMSTRPPHSGKLQKELVFSDPKLSRFIYGSGVERYVGGIPEFEIWRIPESIPVSRAWAFPVADIYEAGKDPRLLPIPPPARRRMLDEASPIKVVADAGESLTIQGVLNHPSVIVVSDTTYPGWKAFNESSGRQLEIENGFGKWKAIYVNEVGPVTVRLVFDPKSFEIGSQITIGTFVLLLTFSCLAGFSRTGSQWL